VSWAQFWGVKSRCVTECHLPCCGQVTVADALPGLHRHSRSVARLEAVIETPAWDLTVFRVHFGR